MKVLLTADPIGGVWTWAVALAKGLAETGTTVAIAVEGAPLTDAQRHELDALPLAGWWSSPRKVEWMDEPWTDVDANGAWLQEIARETGPDVVHLSSYSHAALGWDAPVVVTAHSCVLTWWRNVKGRDAPPEWTTYRRRVEAGLRGADVVVSPTHAYLRDLTEVYDFDGRTRVVPNGVDRNEGAIGVEGTADKDPLIVAAGRVWDQAKNLTLLESAAPELAWPVVICGDGGQGSHDNVSFTGRVQRDQVNDWMERAGIFCNPAMYEPFGLAALEAATVGCALVLGDIPTLREVWGEAALFVEPDDRDGLVETCNRLAADTELRQSFAQRAVERASRLTEGRMADRYTDVYRSVTSREQRKVATR